MASLAYSAPDMKGRIGADRTDAEAVAVVASTTTLSEEERKEAYGVEKKTQVKLNPLQVCLFPTYLSLPEAVLQDDLRENLQALVSSELQRDYGEDFEYFAFTDAKIDWYSGEESSVCGSLENRLPSMAPDPSSIQRKVDLPTEATPCTCALYSGATVMLKLQTEGGGQKDAGFDPARATPEILEPKISAVLTDELVESLRNEQSSEEDVRRRPVYTELKGTSVSWSAAQRQQGGKLIANPSKPEGVAVGDQLLKEGTSQSSPGDTPVATVDETIGGGSTKIDVVSINAIESSETQKQSANGFDKKRQDSGIRCWSPSLDNACGPVCPPPQKETRARHGRKIITRSWQASRYLHCAFRRRGGRRDCQGHRYAPEVEARHHGFCLYRGSRRRRRFGNGAVQERQERKRPGLGLGGIGVDARHRPDGLEEQREQDRGGDDGRQGNL